MSPAPSSLASVVLAGLLFSAAAQAATMPLGGETSLSGALAGDQVNPSVAIGANGGWVVWQDNSLSRSGLGIGARRFDSEQQPVGNAFRVNKGATGDHERPAVTMLPDGGAAVVWQGGKLGFQDVFIRFIRPDGRFATDDILVSLPTVSRVTRVTTNWMVIRNNKLKMRTQRIRNTISAKVERPGGAVVTTLSDGTVLVAYASARKVEASTQVLAERVREIGSRRITNSILTTVPSSWDSMQDIYLQRFGATGEKIGPEIRANEFLNFNQSAPAVAARADGTFVVAWASEMQGQEEDPVLKRYLQANRNPNGGLPDVRLLHQLDIVGRVFGNSGEAVGSEFIVNSSDRPCNNPSVANDSSGGFTIAWTQKDADRLSSLDIHARAYNASGTPLAESFRVNSHTYGDQFTPVIAAVGGSQLVVWTSLAQDGSREGVYGRWFTGGGIAGAEFRVNTTTLLRQFHPAIAGDVAGRALVVWATYNEGTSFDLAGQRYIAQ